MSTMAKTRVPALATARRAPASVALFGLLALCSVPAIASADARPTSLDTIGAVQRACRRSADGARPELYAIAVPAGAWRFGRYAADDGFLAVDTRHNLRALDGAVEIFPAHLEPMGVISQASGVRRLRAAAPRSELHVGFFLSFDDPDERACLVRPAVGVTTVRVDVAYLEVVGADGGVIARQDTDRLRAWLDDAELDGVAGSGPRGAPAPRRGPTAPVSRPKRGNRRSPRRAAVRSAPRSDDVTRPVSSAARCRTAASSCA